MSRIEVAVACALIGCAGVHFWAIASCSAWDPLDVTLAVVGVMFAAWAAMILLARRPEVHPRTERIVNMATSTALALVAAVALALMVAGLPDTLDTPQGVLAAMDALVVAPLACIFSFFCAKRDAG